MAHGKNRKLGLDLVQQRVSKFRSRAESQFGLARLLTLVLWVPDDSLWASFLARETGRISPFSP